MKTIIVFVVIILVLLICVPSKEKFYGQTLYPGIHAYHRDSYYHGLHGSRKGNHLHFGKFSDYIPIINHILL